MTASQAPAPQASRVPLLALLLLALGTVGVAAAWAAVAMLSGSQAAWMAPLAGLDAAWLMRLGGAPRAWPRVALAVAATVLAIAMANWSIVAAQLAGVMGLPFLDSALRLGPDLAWTLLKLANGPAELAWMALGLVAAAVAAR
jgi:hypothetical protein